MKFIADIMVGKLARYLRMAGCDILYKNTATDDEIIKTALKTGRIVLTRDSLMLTRKEFKSGRIKYLLVRDDRLKNQLKQVRSEFSLSLKPNLIRCIECNSRLVGIRREDVRNKVPPYVYRTQRNFMYCKKCDKYYWRGTHYHNIKNTFLDIK